MARTHHRVSCPTCGMLASPERFHQSYPIRFKSFVYIGAGRGRGRYLWSDCEPDRDVLWDMRAQLRACLSAIEVDLGLDTFLADVPLLSSVSPVVRSCPCPELPMSVAPKVMVVSELVK